MMKSVAGARLLGRLAVVLLLGLTASAGLSSPASAGTNACGPDPSSYYCYFDGASWTHRIAREFLCGERDLPLGAWDRTTSYMDNRPFGSLSWWTYSYRSPGYPSEELFSSKGGVGFSLAGDPRDNKADWYLNLTCV
jgi:hypothetical protein